MPYRLSGDGGEIKFHTLGTGHNRTGHCYSVVTCETHEYKWGWIFLVVALSFFPHERSKAFCSPKDFPALRRCPHRLTESCNISSSRIHRSTAETIKPLWCLFLKSLSSKRSPFLLLPAAPAHRLLSLCCKAQDGYPTIFCVEERHNRFATQLLCTAVAETLYSTWEKERVFPFLGAEITQYICLRLS